MAQIWFSIFIQWRYCHSLHAVFMVVFDLEDAELTTYYIISLFNRIIYFTRINIIYTI